VDDAQVGQALDGFGGEHGRAVVGHEGPGQGALFQGLADAVAEFLGPFGQVPLGVATEP